MPPSHDAPSDDLGVPGKIGSHLLVHPGQDLFVLGAPSLPANVSPGMDRQHAGLW